MLGTLDNLHVVKTVEPPLLRGDLQSQMGVEVVGFEYDAFECAHTQTVRGHDTMVSVHHQVTLASLDHDDGFVQTPLELVLPAHQFVHVHFLLCGDEVCDGHLRVVDPHGDVVLLLHESLDVHHLPGTGFLYLGPYDVDVGDDPYELLVLVHDRKVPETVSEKDAGGILDGHGRDGAESTPAHDGAELGARSIGETQQFLGGDISQKVSVLHYGETVEVGVQEFVDDLVHRHVGGDVLDVADHIFADCCAWHVQGEWGFGCIVVAV